jgi:serine/threonine protein kinase
MEFWEEEYNFVRHLSREKSKRFGTTSLLKNKQTGQMVVLKSVDISNNLGFEQLQNEAQFDFDFTGLPKIIDRQISSDKFFILKKYEEGITLSEYWLSVKRRNRSTEIKALVEALQNNFIHLETLDIIHGDIKPENIIVRTEKGNVSCALIDFGLAFRKSDLPNRKTLFQLAYAPPEIILNRLDCADHHSDIFSFCMVVYKLWTGKLPFRQSNPALMTQLQITYPIEKPWRMPKKLWLILEKGLSKHQFSAPPNRLTKEKITEFLLLNNKNRFQRFEELLEAMDKFD